MAFNDLQMAFGDIGLTICFTKSHFSRGLSIQTFEKLIPPYPLYQLITVCPGSQTLRGVVWNRGAACKDVESQPQFSVHRRRDEEHRGWINVAIWTVPPSVLLVVNCCHTLLLLILFSLICVPTMHLYLFYFKVKLKWIVFRTQVGNAIHFGPLCLSQPRRVNYRKEWSVSVGRRRFYDCPSLVILSGTPPNQFWHPLFVFLPPFHPFSQSLPFPLYGIFLLPFSLRMCIWRIVKWALQTEVSAFPLPFDRGSGV